MAGTIQAVLFDWDGTLLNSFHADSSAYLAMFREMGIDWGLDELAQHYSPNWYDVYRAAGLAPERWGAADLAWRAQYSNHRPKLMTGARKVLAAIRKNYRMGLVTSGDRDRVLGQLREFKMTQLFGVRVCSGDTQRKKPHPEPLLEAARRLKVDPRHCVYVGDDERDIAAGLAAGMATVAATYGYLGGNGNTMAWGAHAQIKSPFELLPLLQFRPRA